MRAMKKWIGLTVLVFCTGCASLGKYTKDRGNDFLDCFTAQGGFGGPLPAVELRATHWVTTGAGFAFGEKWGIEGRKAVTMDYRQMGLVGPLGLTSGEDFEKDGSLKDLYTYYSFSSEGEPTLLRRCKGVRVSKSVLLFDVTSIPRFAYHHDCGPSLRSSSRLIQEERKLVEALDVHVDATAALLLGPSVRLGFSPGQFADFVLGFFSLDIAGDDAETQQPKTKEGDRP